MRTKFTKYFYPSCVGLTESLYGERIIFNFWDKFYCWRFFKKGLSVHVTVAKVTILKFHRGEEIGGTISDILAAIEKQIEVDLYV